MTRCVKVRFASGEVFELVPDAVRLAALPADEARAWLAEEFARHDCVASNPMGKVVPADMMVGVARAAGPAGFAGGGDWPARYAAAVACLRAADTVCVDVAASRVD